MPDLQVKKEHFSGDQRRDVSYIFRRREEGRVAGNGGGGGAPTGKEGNPSSAGTDGT